MVQMFDPSKTPRIFGLAPGVDFPKALVTGLYQRSIGRPPEELARSRIIVNTTRMARRIRDLFDQSPALLLPNIQLVTDLESGVSQNIPPAISPLRRRLELVQLISRLLDNQPDLAPRASLYGLADSMAALMDEMHSEGVSPTVISNLDISDESGHWKRATTFLEIVQRYFGDTPETPDANQRQMMITLKLIEQWKISPPQHPVIVAGSTGSRGATFLLMQAVANLPQGALVLPGFDFDMPANVWASLDDTIISEDHPQFRFRKLMQGLSISAADIEMWDDTPAPCPDRNKIVSLALRPAPVTDQWLSYGPFLPDLPNAMKSVTLVNAPTVRDEAMVIAMRLRQAAQDGQTAALVTPDRMLTRQVTAALQRWDIVPDDSAGSPLQLSPPGRFLRHVSSLFHRKLDSETLITVLKHPLTHQGSNRGPHQLNTQNLELFIRNQGLPFPNSDDLRNWAQKSKDKSTLKWADWVISSFMNKDGNSEIPLVARVDEHIELAENIARGAEVSQGGTIWDHQAGKQIKKTVDDLRSQAAYGGTLGSGDYVTLFNAILSGAEGVRDRDSPNSNILIWGTMEARVQGADLLILAGLNEGIWPQSPPPDPWLNRKLRNKAGLLLPERRIGLSAHDFQQAIGAPEVWLTRSIRSDDAETVASRWLNRLLNMLGGLPNGNGPLAIEEMTERGQLWLSRSKALQDPGFVEPAPRPSPKPPKNSRPTHLSVTEIKRLIRDPYAIYARHVLRIRPINPIMRGPDPMMRGIAIHKILEEFVKAARNKPSRNTKTELMKITDTILAKNVPWPHIRALWKARIERSADWFIATEETRISLAKPTDFEIKGSITMPDLGFTLSATADRIDRDNDGSLHIYDYKSGDIPSPSEQKAFDKQLLLEVVIASQGGFENLGPSPVVRAQFVGLNSQKEGNAPLIEEPPEKVWEEFRVLISAYLDPSKGFTSRLAMQKKNDVGDYDQLARFGEWDFTNDATPEDVT